MSQQHQRSLDAAHTSLFLVLFLHCCNKLYLCLTFLFSCSLCSDGPCVAILSASLRPLLTSPKMVHFAVGVESAQQLLLCVTAYTFLYWPTKGIADVKMFHTSGYVLHFYHTPFLRSLLTFDWFGLRGQSVDLNDTIPIRMAG
jgi:hypothetical protein